MQNTSFFEKKRSSKQRTLKTIVAIQQEVRGQTVLLLERLDHYGGTAVREYTQCSLSSHSETVSILSSEQLKTIFYCYQSTYHEI